MNVGLGSVSKEVFVINFPIESSYVDLVVVAGQIVIILLNKSIVNITFTFYNYLFCL